ncbi:hypothetical protein GCM10029964_125130 [Kibdelosporangium lantanae]
MGAVPHAEEPGDGVVGEVGEVTELFQWLTPEQSADAMRDPELAQNIRDELADVLLYLVQLADGLGVDLISAAHAKMDRNEHRFPRVSPSGINPGQRPSGDG